MVGKCPSGKFSEWDFVIVGKCRGGIVSEWENVVWDNVVWENVEWENVMVGNCRVGKCHGILLISLFIFSYRTIYQKRRKKAILI